MSDTLPALVADIGGTNTRVALADGIGWYNDSKGTNVGATLAAINGLGAAIGGKLLLIAGGVGKGQDFSPLSPALAQFGKTLLLIGEDGPAIDRAVSAPLDRRYCATLDEAIAQARALAQAGDAVLLSPACASLDMFKHYEDRGDQFAAGVQRLLEGT